MLYWYCQWWRIGEEAQDWFFQYLLSFLHLDYSKAQAVRGRQLILSPFYFVKINLNGSKERFKKDLKERYINILFCLNPV